MVASLGVILGGLGIALGALEAGTHVRGEAAAGIAPVAPEDPALGAVTLVAEPGVALRLHEPEWQVVTGYAPRLFWRQPNAAGLDRPLLLHRGGVGHRANLTRRTRVFESAFLTRGEVDYTGSRLVAFTPGQASQLDVAVLDYYEYSGEVGLETSLDRRHTLDIIVGAGQSGALDSSDLPTHQRIGATPRLRMILTRRDTLAVPVSGELHKFDDVELASNSVVVEWGHLLSRRASLGLAGGARYARRLDTGNDDMYAVARASLSGTAYAHGYERANGSVAISITPSLDVIRAQYRAVAGLDAAGDYRLGPRWWVSAAMSYYVPANATPLEPPEAESAFFIDAPVTYRPAPNVSLFAGVRHGWRAPHPADGFHIEQAQVWGFLGAAFRESTGRSAGWIE